MTPPSPQYATPLRQLGTGTTMNLAIGSRRQRVHAMSNHGEDHATELGAAVAFLVTLIVIVLLTIGSAACVDRLFPASPPYDEAGQ